VENAIFIKEEIKESKYIKGTKKIILPLQEKLKKLDISYNSLKPFFKEEKDDKDNNKFKNRLLYIFLLAQDESQKCFDILKIKMNEIKKNIKDLENLLSYFSHFLSNHHSQEIEKLKGIISDMKKQSLEKDHKKEINEFTKFLKKISEYELRQKSSFLNILYNDKMKKKFDDEKAMNKSKSEIEDLKNFFEGKKYNKELLAQCLKAFKKPNINEIKKELDILSKLLKIKEDKYNEKKKDLVNDLLLLLNRENLIHISKAIQNFLEKIIIKDNDFIQKISNIIKDSKEKKGIDIIKSCKEKLKELNFLRHITNNSFFYFFPSKKFFRSLIFDLVFFTVFSSSFFFFNLL
jgi:hypothetical protein